ncbi:hypothetical protein HZH68_017185 [Vespula germanica]|uniref:Alcohol dehydrogenase n=1 Tax=Vespula germanica TaxID=30212 RepID=A0A834MPW2_VESGE|nr:hypothetical protein HZH68_017185 [Vespula germanica]
MKALVYHGEHNISLELVDKPTILKPTDAIVKVTRTTICGTDLGIYKGKNPEVASGRILGHEGIGIVEEVGESVSNVKVGDEVLIGCITPCGKCDNCRKQLYSHCRETEDNSLYKYPQTINDEIAVMLSDALPTGHEIGVQYGHVSPGKSVAIIGAGPVGMGALLTAQLYSPGHLIVIDLDKNRLEMARKLGATHTLVPNEKLFDNLKEIVGEDGVDVAIEAVGIPQT